MRAIACKKVVKMIQLRHDTLLIKYLIDALRMYMVISNISLHMPLQPCSRTNW